MKEFGVDSKAVRGTIHEFADLFKPVADKAVLKQAVAKGFNDSAGRIQQSADLAFAAVKTVPGALLPGVSDSNIPDSDISSGLAG